MKGGRADRPADRGEVGWTMSIPGAISRWLNGALRWRRQRATPTGKRGEDAAALHLRRNNYRLLGRNLANRFGEIDIVALAPDGRTIVIVEVKARQVEHLPGDDLLPELHVNRHKQDKLVALASWFARKRKWTDRPIRFDVIGVDLLPEESGAKPVIRHHEAAFESRW